jgi:hypothetical protein
MKDLIKYLNAGTSIHENGGFGAAYVYDALPEGWRPLAKLGVRLTELMDNRIVEIGIRAGLLVVKFKGNNELDNQICELFRNAIAQKSSVTCMICSKRGFRRKREALVPTLCGPHYVEYINYLDDNGL